MTASLHALGGGRDAGLYYVNDPNREARPRSRDEYYVRDGGGTWWSTGETIVRHGAEIDKETFRDLCGGIDPSTGKPLVRGSGAKHRAGWDVTFSAPKTLSVLWMAGDENQRAMLHQLHRAAVQDALGFLVKERLVEVRLGQGGYIREAPTDVIVGCFDHYTSREGDPNVHTHSVVLNVAGCQDQKKCRTLEPERLFNSQLLVGLAFRASLARGLADNGFSLRAAGRNQFEIAGIPENVIEAFSKRSHQIEELVGRDASGAQKELAALATRGSKDEIPVGEVLEQRWRDELSETGIDPWKAARDFVPSREIETMVERAFDPPEIEGTGPVAVAASKLFRHQSVVTRKELLHGALVEATFLAVGIDQVWAELQSYEDRGILVRLADEERSECWTTPSIAATEASLLRAADRLDEHDWFRPDALEAALANAPHLSEEQTQAIRFSANRDGVAICEAPAGTGKTVLTKSLVESAQRSGLTVLGLSPTWIAADELSKSCGIDAHAIAKWRYDQSSGLGLTLDAKTLIVIDEVGLAGVRELESVLKAAHEAHAKVVCFGDRRQLQAVPGGSALRAVADVVARGAVLSQVRRQEVAWQRAASMVMARGDPEAGLRAYARNEKLELVAGEAAAQARVIQAWNEYRAAHGDDVLIVTRRNADAAALNKAARLVLRAEGRLTGPNRSLTAVGRDKKIGPIELSQGDRIRFGENLPQLQIRNGTRGTIERIESDIDQTKVAIRLEDGRLIHEPWAALVREQPGRLSSPPRISSAYAGTAYSVQARTSAAAVLYIARPTDAREVYVGLTRHRIDAYVVAECDRLAATVQRRQLDGRATASPIAIRERLFTEARSYAEKANVADYVVDRIEFMRTGKIEIRRDARSLNLGIVARAAQRTFEAAREISIHWFFILPNWRLVESMRHMRRQVSRRVAGVVHAIKDRLELRAKERVVTQDRDMSR
ncbi:relaxase domain-containing protein [Bradyrhizobium sp. 186]|uniref:MobF family relaxase n=1 Tax=Bradyrhizobium sp. 186 TaxID=2782654 RepID=UPI002000D3C0|nr:MobF family relaxase [Bradyrhizobium sp. 186]UPK39529.1 relaxase domain-containing protein [Bradyrhizobium sp. 186]